MSTPLPSLRPLRSAVHFRSHISFHMSSFLYTECCNRMVPWPATWCWCCRRRRCWCICLQRRVVPHAEASLAWQCRTVCSLHMRCQRQRQERWPCCRLQKFWPRWGRPILAECLQGQASNTFPPEFISCCFFWGFFMWINSTTLMVILI